MRLGALLEHLHNIIVDNMQHLKQGATLQGGRYRIESVLGQGSFGITYVASDFKSGQLVAIKEFFMGDLNERSADNSSVTGTEHAMAKKYRKKFYTEAKNLSALQHDNIVKVYDVFDDNNTTYYSMQFIDGENLNDYIKQRGVISEKEALCLVRAIAQALGYMHEHKMLHLDLKPKNIMYGRNGRIVLIDFGLSKQYDDKGEPETSTTIGLGTPGYAPLEQANYIQDGTFPATLDIYALGATFYKMLTGQTPPLASVLLEGFPIHKLEEKEISKQTIAFLLKSMEPVVSKRYQTITDVINAIDMSLSQYEKNTSNVVGTDNDKNDERTIYDDKPLSGSKKKSKKPLLFYFLLILVASLILLYNFGGNTVVPNDSLDTKINNSSSINSDVSSGSSSEESNVENDAIVEPSKKDNADILDEALRRGDYSKVQQLANEGYAPAYVPLAEYYLRNNEYSLAENYAQKAVRAGYNSGNKVLETLNNLGYYD